MIKIAIIEDEQTHTELISSYLRTWGRAQGQTVLIQTFLSAESFLFVWEETNDFDILFVDIQMGKMNGVEMARKVRERASSRDFAGTGVCQLRNQHEPYPV